MIIPIGHESDRVRRMPWITFSIIAICLIVHVFVSIETNKQKNKLESQLVELFQFYFEHPYLELDPEINKLLSAGEEDIEQLLNGYKTYNKPPKSSVVLEEEQEHFNEIAVKVKGLVGEIPFRKWGLIPTKKTATTLFTHMFVHGGWLHLIGNLLLLYLSGPFVEDAWGRPIYLACYLVIGIFSAFMFSVHYPNFSGPLIGASGAISGMMGAFLIRFWRTRIKFIYFFFFPFLIRGSFKAPAWIMLPMWFVLEMFNARMMDSIDPQSGGGVAHWAHVWGFALGVAVALGLKYFRIEERFINKKIETQTSYVNPVYKKFQEAQALLDDGKKTESYSLLLNVVRSDPSHPDIGEMLMGLGAELGRTEEAAPVFVGVIEHEIRKNQMESALRHYDQLNKVVSKIHMNAHSKIMLVEHLIKLESKKEAISLLNQEIMNEIGPTSPPGLLLKLSAVALQLDRKTAENVIGISCQNQEMPEIRKQELVEKLAMMDAKPISGASSTDPPEPNPVITPNRDDRPNQLQNPEPIPKQKIISAYPAVPLDLKNQKIFLELAGIGKKWMALSGIKLISVVKISESGKKPFLLLDLILNMSVSPSPSIKAIRINSKTFNPLSLISNLQNPLDGFRTLIRHMQKSSQSRSFPDQESLRLEKLTIYESVDSYERSLVKHVLVE